MIFNSTEFMYFLPIVFIFYWFIFNKNLTIQNFLVLVSSYIFYGWWDYRFLSLIILSTIFDYFMGLKIFSESKPSKRKFYLFSSIIFNLSILGFFKYYNFFIESWIDFIYLFGFQTENVWTLNIILPVGISFYTFQTMSYSLDIYNNKIEPTKNFIAFSSFVAFFPQLVAGPIERASHLLPQMLNPRKIEYKKFYDGFNQMMVGFFKKIVVADNIAKVVDQYYMNTDLYSNNALFTLIVIFLYSFQIYCDFSGYSDIAIGISKFFGFNLNANFKRPYFAFSFSNFWQRWHISLSSYLRDYLYIPLGGNRNGDLSTYKNLMLTMLIGGLWHGASLNFIFWGFLHGFYLSIERIIKPTKSVIYSIIIFMLATLAWIPFRAQNFNDMLNVINSLLFNQFSISLPFSMFVLLKIFIVLFILVLYDYLIEKELIKNSVIISFVFFLLIIILGNFNNNNFIYFQF